MTTTATFDITVGDGLTFPVTVRKRADSFATFEAARNRALNLLDKLGPEATFTSFQMTLRGDVTNAA